MQAREGDAIKTRFVGYAASLEEEMQASMVYLSPRLSGLGLSTKVMLGLEYGVPTVTTPHGAHGYVVGCLGKLCNICDSYAHLRLYTHVHYVQVHDDDVVPS